MGISSALLIGNKVNSKNIYYETFLTYTQLALKKGSCKFVLQVQF